MNNMDYMSNTEPCTYGALWDLNRWFIDHISPRFHRFPDFQRSDRWLHDHISAISSLPRFSAIR
jgi:hypothetical protein